MRSLRILGVVLSIAVVAAGTHLFAEGAGKEMSPEEQMMMKKWEAFMTPGEAHSYMAKRAGTWSFAVKMWHAPGAPPEESTGTSEMKMVMDGRFMVEHVTGTAMGMPFQGMGWAGYDNLKKKYVSTWIDNMGTGIMTMEGTCDTAADACIYRGESPDVMTGGYKTVKAMSRGMGKDKFMFEMYDKGPDGKEWKNFEIVYTRKQ